MQDKTNENQSINQKGLMHDEEMKRTLDSLKETEEHVTHKLDSFETKARLAFEDFLEEHPFYQNLKILGYNIVFSYYNVLNFKSGKKMVDIHFNLVWGDIEDKDFHRQECKETLSF